MLVETPLFAVAVDATAESEPGCEAAGGSPVSGSRGAVEGSGEGSSTKVASKTLWAATGSSALPDYPD
jgi:hypothetical protein